LNNGLKTTFQVVSILIGQLQGLANSPFAGCIRPECIDEIHSLRHSMPHGFNSLVFVEPLNGNPVETTTIDGQSGPV
jgi:hypothetical protein